MLALVILKMSFSVTSFLGNFDVSVVTEGKRDLSRAANLQYGNSMFQLVLPVSINNIL